ncbi:hypothetical protein INT45_003347 [Circinella minor]|uniref:Uncharacterized protein n=1 Tax=Circinella minor TaxID=1195481 RepID=A0A8H7SBC8_9FUNG|nr:hypothetical protein INT45_003347 [Circinella minor]
MLATHSPLFATEIYPHSSPVTMTSKNDFVIDDFYYTLQSILDEDHHIHHQQKQQQQQQQNDIIAYSIDKSPVWHNRGVNCTTSINDETRINSCNDDKNKQVSWNKGFANSGTKTNLWSTSSSNNNNDNNTMVANYNGRRRSSIQSLSTIKEEEE